MFPTAAVMPSTWTFPRKSAYSAMMMMTDRKEKKTDILSRT